MICQQAWDYIREASLEPRLVFAHDRLLLARPAASLHYRGLCGLPQKRVQALATDVTKWEDGTAQRMNPDRCLQVARVYNTVISSIIVESTDWTMENGYRTIMATLGIQLDGSIRNLIGNVAEADVRRYLVDWLDEQGYIQNQNIKGTRFELEGPLGSCRMQFGSDPDVEFLRDGRCIATIEIKGGTDPAGALERLGAIQKSFAKSPASAKNYLVAGVVTPAMRQGLDDMDNFEMDFLLNDLRSSQAERSRFMEEIFNHGLRITRFTASAPNPGN